MNWLQHVIKRPIAVAMIFLSLILLGAISLVKLPVDLLPESSYPILSVTTHLGGYSPLEIEQTLTKPMESSLASLNNLVRFRSISQEGKSNIQMEFKLGTDMDFVIQDVRERLDYLTPTFPEDTLKPQIVKYDPNASPVLAISLFGTIDEVALREAAETLLQKNLARIPGVANIEVMGGRRLEILIEPDLEQLRASGLSILALTDLLKQNNLELSLGSLSRGQISLPLRSSGEFRTLNDIKKLGIRRTRSGSIVHLDQVARVSFTSQVLKLKSSMTRVPISWTPLNDCVWPELLGPYWPWRWFSSFYAIWPARWPLWWPSPFPLLPLSGSCFLPASV
jgi:HAE1 family hydrophobic/amphiphilic exporter-1